MADLKLGRWITRRSFRCVGLRDRPNWKIRFLAKNRNKDPYAIMAFSMRVDAEAFSVRLGVSEPDIDKIHVRISVTRTVRVGSVEAQNVLFR